MDRGRKVYKSSHPYEDNLDVYFTHCAPGASKYTISFHDDSATEDGYDYLRFYKIDAQDPRSKTWGEGKYSGRKGSNNFPGLSGKPPLQINAPSFEVYFRSDSGGSDWGYEFTVRWDDGNFHDRRSAMTRILLDAFPDAVKQPISGVLGSYCLPKDGGFEPEIREDKDLKSKEMALNLIPSNVYHVDEMRVVMAGQLEVLRGHIRNEDGGWITLEIYNRSSAEVTRNMIQVETPQHESTKSKLLVLTTP